MFISEKICVQNSLIKCFVSVPVYLPLAFSPNNDGVNDTFHIEGEQDRFISLSILIPLLIVIAFFTLIERKLMASIQRRKGPNRYGY